MTRRRFIDDFILLQLESFSCQNCQKKYVPALEGEKGLEVFEFFFPPFLTLSLCVCVFFFKKMKKKKNSFLHGDQD